MSEENIFLLSPANLNGIRGKMLFNPEASFALAKALRSREGAALGEVYGFVGAVFSRQGRICGQIRQRRGIVEGLGHDPWRWALSAE